MIGHDELIDLVEAYDERPCFLSVYADPRSRSDLQAIERRTNEVRKALKGDRHLSSIFEENLERASEILRSARSPVAIFLSVENGVERWYEVGLDIGPLMVVDTSPYLLPLLRYQEENEPFVLLYIDENHARIISVEGGGISGTEDLRESIFHQHKKGGWSQMRYQRNREIALNHFFDEVVAELRKSVEDTGARRIIVAGPGVAREVFVRRLPHDLARAVIGSFAISGDESDRAMVDRATPYFFERERIEEREAVDALRSGILRSEGVVYGLEETYRATEEGRADLILVSMDLRVPGWKCERCREVSFSSPACPRCGMEGVRVDVVEELAEKALEMGTRLEFIKDSDPLDELGGVGAFLRF